MSTAEILQSALTQAHVAYTARNPRSHASHKQALNYLPGGDTRSVLHSTPFPLCFSSGHGSSLTSLDGDTYTDFLGEYSAGIFGHSNVLIAKAVNDAMSQGWNFGGINSFECRLAKAVCERFGLQMVRFTNSGTEANTMALAVGLEFVKMQQQQQEKGHGNVGKKIKRKRKIMVFTNGYHGGTISFPMKLVTAQRNGEDMPSANLPHEFIVAPFNNIDETRAIADELLDPITDPSESSSDKESSLAIILVEPLQGAGGCRPASRSFLKFLRTLADENSALLVVDEVMTSRLGAGGLCAELGIRPDLMTLGKWIGGGMSFGAFGGREDIMGLFDPVRGRLSHAGTFNNNVLSMAAGLAGLEICSPERIMELNSLGERLKRDILDVLDEYNVISPEWRKGDNTEFVESDSFQRHDNGGDTRRDDNVRGMFLTGRGSLISVRFSGPDSNLWQALFFHHMLGEKVYLATRGYMALTIELTEDDVARFVAAVRKFVKSYHQLLKIEE